MELRRYALMLWRWLWLIVLGTALAGGAAYFTSRQQVPVYQAGTTMLVSPGQSAVMNGTASYAYDADRLAATYAQLLTSRPVMEEVVKNLGPAVSPGAFSAAVSAVPVRNTQLLRLTVEDTDPARAAAIANEVPKVFIRQNDVMQTQRFAESKAGLQKQLQDTQGQIARLATGIAALQAASQPDQAEIDRQQRDLAQLQQGYTGLFQSYQEVRLEEARQLDTLVVTEAARPSYGPIRPKTRQNTLLAAVVGALLALGIAYLVEYLDDVLKNPDEVQETLGLAALSAVPAIDEKDSGGELPVMASSHSSATEAYRVLRTNLQFAAAGKPLRSLLITSPSPGEGKSISVANLGAALAQAGKRVVLVDADLHRPRLHRIFRLPNNVGITTALVDVAVPLDDLLHETEMANLRVLTSGPLPPNPAELLGASRMRDVLAQLEADADLVILDSPPVLALSDATVLATQVNGVLLVLDATRTRRDVARRAVAVLQHVEARLVGAVLNRIPTRGAGSYYYYSYYGRYGQHYGPQDGSGKGDRQGPAGGSGGRAGPLRRSFPGGHKRARPAPAFSLGADPAEETTQS